MALLLGACCHPVAPCDETLCADSCVNVASDGRNCGACGTICQLDQECVSGACVCADAGCQPPDLYVTCWHQAGMVAVRSSDGSQLPVAQIVAEAPGSGLAVRNANFISPIFLSSSTLMVIDTINDQIDQLDVSAWPPQFRSAIASGMGQFDPVQMLVCAGKLAVLRTSSLVVELFDLQTWAVVGEVSLGAAAQFPAFMACDGAHSVYVTDTGADTVTEVDVNAGAIVTSWSVPADDRLPDLSDGGVINPSPSAVAFGPADGGPLWVALQDLGPDYGAAGPATVLAIAPTLQSVSAAVDPGAQCLNGLALVFSPDGATLYESCGGDFTGLNAVSYLGRLTVAQPDAQVPIVLPLSNPAAMAFLKNGLLAIADEAQPHLALYNPFDGGVRDLAINCPGLPDGGADPLQFISGVVAAP